jgi:hypothetical protein
MLSRRSCSILTFLSFLTLLVPTVLSQDFSVIVLPDTQNESQFFPMVLNAQTSWIVNNQQALNIQMVLGEGDIVNDGADPSQQQSADAAIRLLDTAGIPYELAIGNHDYDGANPKASRSVIGFNQTFGPARYAAYPFYQGMFPAGSNENFYGVLTISGQQYLFLILEYRPRSTSLDWAESILAAHPNMKAIVVTHSFLLPTGKREDLCDTQDMPLPANANGQDMWARLREHANVIMVLNGHFTNGTSSHRTDLGDSDNLVNQMFINFQTFPDGGDGWLRILTFHPATNSISVQTFSPFLNQFQTDSAHQFTVPFQNSNPTTGIGSVSGQVRNVATCAAIPGVTVSTGSTSTVSAADGTYSLPIAPGSYAFGASGAGWKTAMSSEAVNDSLDTQLNFYLTAAAPPCGLNTLSPSVTICMPAANATLASPVHVVGGSTDAKTVSFLQIYVDGTAVLTQTGASIDAQVPMAIGVHRLTLQAKDSAGTIFKQTENINVGSPSPTPTPTPAPTPSPTPIPSPTPTPTPVACVAGPVSPSVNICLPANGNVLSSPVHVLAATKDSLAVAFVQIYVDGSPVLTQTGGALNTTVAMAIGAHRFTVQAKDSAGVIFKQTINITVH